MTSQFTVQGRVRLLPTNKFADPRLAFVCAALLVAALQVWSIPSAQAATVTFAVSATSGWQKTPLNVTKGQTYTASYVSGSWTVDKATTGFPQVGPEGYKS